MPDLTLDIDSLSPTGDGIARYGRERIAVPFTIPGERVRVRVDGRARDARVIEVLRPSPHRVVARCAHFGPDAEPGIGPCGGCTWQHIAYPEQLRLKSDLVTRVVRSTVPGAPAALPTLAGAPAGNPWGYRHKVHFVFGSTPRSGRSPGALTMGHYVRGSRRVIPVRECPVHDERGNTLAFELHDACARARVQAAGAADTRRARAGRNAGTLKSLAVRVGWNSPEIMATIVVTDERDKRVRLAARRLPESPVAPTSLHLNIHPRADRFIFGRDTRRITGPERMRDRIAGASFLISPTAFFQTNPAAAERLVSLVLDAAPASAAALDLYAGAGLFAIPLAMAGHDVVAVEENRAAVADGEASLRLNRIAPERCRFIARRAESAIRSLPRFDFVVLDPPREGCDPGVLDAVFASMRPRTAVYVSCNPEALARDLAIVDASGYTVESLQPVDMFPHTAHVETVVVLRKRANRREG